MTRPYRALAARFAATAVTLTATVIAVRLAYETPEAAQATSAGIAACAFLGAFSLLLSAVLSFGWESGRLRAAARYEASLGQERPLGPVCRGGYRIVADEPNGIYEAWHPADELLDECTREARHARQQAESAVAA